MKAAASVSTYIADVPAAQRAAIKKLRALCKQSLKGYEECIEYGVPSYKRKGVLEVSFASRKQYVALYVLKKDVVDEFRAKLSASSIGKGCIRFGNPDNIDFEAIGQLLRRNADSKSGSCED
ncbi:MAG TPA: DUF1801 domain-containing protein [Candidatus Udaeobacter sp.]|nr:DUF1801 domain-containing protein [Candidatus Udaeobacter sp.]